MFCHVKRLHQKTLVVDSHAIRIKMFDIEFRMYDNAE